MMSPVHEPEQHTENHDPTVHQNAVIHVLDIWVCRRRPHGEEGSEQGIQYRYDGEWNAEPSEPERAPRDLRFGGPQALVEHDGCGKDEGGVVARYDEGDEGAKPDGGAYVDEREEEVDDGCCADGVEREVGALVHLVSHVSNDEKICRITLLPLD